MKNCETCIHRGEPLCCQGARKMRIADLSHAKEFLAQGNALTAWNYDLDDLASKGQVIQHQGMKLQVSDCSGPLKFLNFWVQRLTVKQVGVVR